MCVANYILTLVAAVSPLLLFHSALIVPVVNAAPPSQLNGEYTFQCYDSSLTVSLILAGGGFSGGDMQGGSSTVPVYCGPNPPNPESDPQIVLDAYAAYQERLTVAEKAFDKACNDLVAFLTLPPRPNDCSVAASVWRLALNELNNNAARLSPARLSITVQQGEALNELINLYDTKSDFFLQDGSRLPMSYNINREGKILAINLDGKAKFASEQAGCGGVLAVASQGRLFSGSMYTSSTLVNNYGGLLTCGVAAGNLAIVVAATMSVKASAIAVMPPAGSPTQAPANSAPSGCFSGRSMVQVEDERDMVPMQALKIRDKVLVSDGSYSTVYSFGHYEPDAMMEYFQIKTGNMNPKDLLEISSNHLIHVYDTITNTSGIAPAESLKIGDFLVSSISSNEDHLVSTCKITSIRKLLGRGAYTPLTNTGHIVVSGVLASNYVALPTAFHYLPFKTQHTWQHLALTPYRWYCYMTGCMDETYDAVTALSPGVQMWMPAMRAVEWTQLKWNTHSNISWVVLVTILTAIYGIKHLTLNGKCQNQGQN